MKNFIPNFESFLNESKVADAILDLIIKVHQNPNDTKSLHQLAEMLGLNPQEKKELEKVKKIIKNAEDAYAAFDLLLDSSNESVVVEGNLYTGATPIRNLEQFSHKENNFILDYFPSGDILWLIWGMRGFNDIFKAKAKWRVLRTYQDDQYRIIAYKTKFRGDIVLGAILKSDLDAGNEELTEFLMGKRVLQEKLQGPGKDTEWTQMKFDDVVDKLEDMVEAAEKTGNYDAIAQFCDLKVKEVKKLFFGNYSEGEIVQKIIDMMESVKTPEGKKVNEVRTWSTNYGKVTYFEDYNEFLDFFSIKRNITRKPEFSEVAFLNDRKGNTNRLVRNWFGVEDPHGDFLMVTNFPIKNEVSFYDVGGNYIETDLVKKFKLDDYAKNYEKGLFESKKIDEKLSIDTKVELDYLIQKALTEESSKDAYAGIAFIMRMKVDKVAEIFQKHGNKEKAIWDEIMGILKESVLNEDFSTDWVKPGILMPLGGKTVKVITIDDFQNGIVWRIKVKDMNTGNFYKAVWNGQMFIMGEQIEAPICDEPETLEDPEIEYNAPLQWRA